MDLAEAWRNCDCPLHRSEYRQIHYMTSQASQTATFPPFAYGMIPFMQSGEISDEAYSRLFPTFTDMYIWSKYYSRGIVPNATMLIRDDWTELKVCRRQPKDYQMIDEFYRTKEKFLQDTDTSLTSTENTSDFYEMEDDAGELASDIQSENENCEFPTRDNAHEGEKHTNESTCEGDSEIENCLEESRLCISEETDGIVERDSILNADDILSNLGQTNFDDDDKIDDQIQAVAEGLPIEQLLQYETLAAWNSTSTTSQPVSPIKNESWTTKIAIDFEKCYNLGKDVFSTYHLQEPDTNTKDVKDESLYINTCAEVIREVIMDENIDESNVIGNILSHRHGEYEEITENIILKNATEYYVSATIENVCKNVVGFERNQRRKMQQCA